MRSGQRKRLTIPRNGLIQIRYRDDHLRHTREFRNARFALQVNTILVRGNVVDQEWKKGSAMLAHLDGLPLETHSVGTRAPPGFRIVGTDSFGAQPLNIPRGIIRANGPSRRSDIRFDQFGPRPCGKALLIGVLLLGDQFEIRPVREADRRHFRRAIRMPAAILHRQAKLYKFRLQLRDVETGNGGVIDLNHKGGEEQQRDRHASVLRELARCASNCAMAFSCCRMKPNSSTPSSRQCFAKPSTGNSMARPSGSVTVCAARSTCSSASGCSKSHACTSRGTTIGSSEFFSEFCLKISAKEVLMTARKPYCVSAHGACSRELPQPKLSPASRIFAAFASEWFSGKSGFG